MRTTISKEKEKRRLKSILTCLDSSDFEGGCKAFFGGASSMAVAALFPCTEIPLFWLHNPYFRLVSLYMPYRNV
jgi:hypothetical protein